MATRKDTKTNSGVRFDSNRRKLRTGETHDEYNGCGFLIRDSEWRKDLPHSLHGTDRIFAVWKSKIYDPLFRFRYSLA